MYESQAAKKQEDQAAKMEQEWKGYWRKSKGELLRLKFGEHPFRKALAEMELERRAFVRDKLFDRILAVGAIIISVIALLIRSH
jgi:hypothetical protein